MKKQFDVLVIGGGAAGLFSASIANALGAKTVLIEKTRLGGDCTWYGCMPSKAILKSSHVANLLKNLKKFGLSLNADLKLDTSGVMGHVRDVVNQIAAHHPNEVFEKRGIKVILGVPKFIDSSTVEINQELISAKKIIICTGSHPVVPPIEGLDGVDYLTNETIFNLESLPKSMIVLGGGPIGLELAQSLNGLGVKVKIIEMFDRLLFREEPEVSKLITDKLGLEGVGIFTGKKAIKVENQNNQIAVTFAGKDNKIDKIIADSILVAVGRAANVSNLNLELAKVKYSKKGIEVNQFLQTTNKNIFACGDVVGPYMFSHVAAYQASVAVRNALLRRIAWQKVNYSNAAWATFTEPESSHLGLTEKEALLKHKTVKIYTNDYTVSDRSITDVETVGFVKIITDKKGFILGAHVVGAKASELMQGLLVAKANKIKLSKIASVLYIYPTLSEIIKKTAAKSLVEKMNNPIVKFALRLLKK